jgi:hypothetical protein
VQAIIAKLLTDKPRPVTELRETVPVHVAATVHKALAKLPADRFGGAGVLVNSLDDPTFRFMDDRGAAAEGEGPRGLLGRHATLGVALVAAAAGALGLVAGLFLPQEDSQGPGVFDVGLPAQAPMSLFAGLTGGSGFRAFTVSGTGEFLVYQAAVADSTELWYRSLVDTEAHAIPGTGGASYPVLSPSANRLAFITMDGVKVVSLAGGQAEASIGVSHPRGLVWQLEDRIAILDNHGNRFRSVDLATGEDLVTVDLGHQCNQPWMGPDEDGPLFCHLTPHFLAFVLNVGSEEFSGFRLRRTPAPGSMAGALKGLAPVMVNEELFTYLNLQGDLQATRIDPASLHLGLPTTVLRGVRREAYTGAVHYMVTEEGDLFFVPGENAAVGHLVKAYGSDSTVVLPIEPAAFQLFDLTPDGKRLAAVIQGAEREEVWIYDLERGLRNLWVTADFIGELRWDTGGTRLVARAIPTFDQPLIMLRGSPTSSAPPDTLREFVFEPQQTLPDDRVLGFADGHVVVVDFSSEPVAVDSLARGSHCAVSPDGRWLAFGSRSYSQGENEVFIQPFPEGDRRYQVSLGGGSEPIWLNSDELLFRDGQTWYLARVGAGENPVVEAPRVWLRDPRFSDTKQRSHQLAPDGGLIYLRGSGESTATYLRVIPDWVSQAMELVGGADQ